MKFWVALAAWNAIHLHETVGFLICFVLFLFSFFSNFKVVLAYLWNSHFAPVSVLKRCSSVIQWRQTQRKIVDSEGLSGKKHTKTESSAVHLKLKNFTSWGWRAFQTESATQKRSKIGGQITTIIKDTKIENYRPQEWRVHKQCL